MSALKSRNVRVGNRRTSVRLEPVLWAALEDIAAAKGQSIHDICSELAQDTGLMVGGLTSALRVYIVTNLMAR